MGMGLGQDFTGEKTINLALCLPILRPVAIAIVLKILRKCSFTFVVGGRCRSLLVVVVVGGVVDFLLVGG